MRHYFGYDINGDLLAIETYGPAGWPTDHCMEDPQCVKDSVCSLRESRAKNAPGIIDWVLYDCPCNAGQGAILKNCTCVNSKYGVSYVDVASRVLRPKPMTTVYIDSVAIQSGDIITRDPGTQMTLKVTGNGVPDGTVVRCVQKGSVDLVLDDEWELEFSNGVSTTKVLTAPAQGARGIVNVSGTLIRPVIFSVRGFAS